MWQHLVVLNCIILFFVVKYFTMMDKSTTAAEVIANRYLRSKCMQKMKRELYGTISLNLMDILSGIIINLILFSVSDSQGIVEE